MSYQRFARDESADSPTDALKRHLRGCLSGRNLDDAETLLEKLVESLSTAKDEMDPHNGGPRENLEPRGFGANDAALAMDAKPNSAEGRIALRRAVQRCAPIIGEDAVLAHDSAEGVYRAALRSLGVAERDMHAHALPYALTAATRQHKSGSEIDNRHGGWSRPSPTLATDGGADFNRRFPGLAKVRSL